MSNLLTMEQINRMSEKQVDSLLAIIESNEQAGDGNIPKTEIQSSVKTVDGEEYVPLNILKDKRVQYMLSQWKVGQNILDSLGLREKPKPTIHPFEEYLRGKVPQWEAERKYYEPKISETMDIPSPFHLAGNPPTDLPFSVFGEQVRAVPPQHSFANLVTWLSEWMNKGSETQDTTINK